jgi:hypothetical protein
MALAAWLTLSVAGLWAADLSIDLQVNATAQDPNNYLTFKGGINTVEKDQFVPGADATSGASKLASTEYFNGYRFDAKGNKTLPGGLRNVFLYAVADDSIRTGDGLTVTKNADGSILVRFIHRGTAFEFVTDKAGHLALPTTAVKSRVIGTTDNKIIHSDFSTTGKVADVNWSKVWDASIADGKQLGTTTVKTGKIVIDAANSDIYVWTGTVQFAFDGNILRAFAALDAKKK